MQPSNRVQSRLTMLRTGVVRGTRVVVGETCCQNKGLSKKLAENTKKMKSARQSLNLSLINKCVNFGVVEPVIDRCSCPTFPRIFDAHPHPRFRHPKERTCVLWSPIVREDGKMSPKSTTHKHVSADATSLVQSSDIRVPIMEYENNYSISTDNSFVCWPLHHICY